MDYQRHEDKGALTIEQQEGYILALQDKLEDITREIAQLKNTLKIRKELNR